MQDLTNTVLDRTISERSRKKTIRNFDQVAWALLP